MTSASSGADGRRHGAEDEGVLQRDLGRGQLEEREIDVMHRRVPRRHQCGRDRREGGVEQREVGEEHRQHQHDDHEGAGRHEPPAELDQARLGALAADHGVALAPEDHGLAAQQNHGEHQQWQRRRGGELGLGRILEQAPDLGGHGVEAGGQCEDRGRAEQDHRLQKRDQRAGQKGRQRQRYRDAARSVPGACAEHGGGILEVAGDAVERVGDQHEHVRERVAGDHEDQPRQGVDVEQVLVLRRAGDDPVELVEKPAVRRGEDFPGHRAEERRRHERCRHQRADGARHRHVGARHQPAHRRRDDAAREAGRDRDDESGHQRIDKLRLAEQRAELIERERARLRRRVDRGEAVVEQP